jgi:hypothetical protein
VREIRDRALPPDHDAFLAAEPPSGRVIVIAPTRAACETIELAMQLNISTVLERQHGEEIRRLAGSGDGFGIVAGTGTGKTLAVRPIAEEILRAPLRVGVVNREREATPETPSWNLIIVTTGIARRWFQDGDILARDTLVVDEIHQTSAELELCLALGKRVGCRFIWLSATVDPAFYESYLTSASVLESSSFDPARGATVKVVRKDPLEFLDDKFLRYIAREKRGVGVFLPTRAQVEQVAEHVASVAPRISAAHYHGGEPIRVIRPFLEEGVRKPFVLAMTAAGQSALNVKGLDTVVIDDVRFANIIDRGRNVLTRLHLGANEILQMAGRVHGRVEGGRVFILSDRALEFGSLRPEAPQFQLAGDSERVAMTCADLGVRADELDLPVPLDRSSYRAAVRQLEERGIIENARLSAYGKSVEALPVDRPWAELIVNSPNELLPCLAVMSSVDSLHRMTRAGRNLKGLVVPGSDHLTAYNLYAEAYAEAGYAGEVYGLPRHLFDEEKLEHWAERRGALVKSLEDAALATASVFRSVGVPLPSHMARAGEAIHRAFCTLLARIMPLQLVIDEATADGDEVRVGRDSACGSWGAVAGTIRYFAARDGSARAAIEGTQLPIDLVRGHARRREARVAYRPQDRSAPLCLEHTLEYFGFELDREVEPIGVFPEEYAARIVRTLAESAARFEARHPSMQGNRAVVNRVREMHRRSGGRTPKLGAGELADRYEEQLCRVRTLDEFRATPLKLLDDDFVDAETARQLMTLPSSVELRGRAVPIDYDVENDGDRSEGVARLRIPGKLVQGLIEEELPQLDRPLRFVVERGRRGAVRAASLDELHELLKQPWMSDELSKESGAGPRRAATRRDAHKKAGRSRRTSRKRRR